MYICTILEQSLDFKVVILLPYINLSHLIYLPQLYHNLVLT